MFRIDFINYLPPRHGSAVHLESAWIRWSWNPEDGDRDRAKNKERLRKTYHIWDERQRIWMVWIDSSSWVSECLRVHAVLRYGICNIYSWLSHVKKTWRLAACKKRRIRFFQTIILSPWLFWKSPSRNIRCIYRVGTYNEWRIKWTWNWNQSLGRSCWRFQ